MDKGAFDKIIAERDELFTENGRLANTLCADNLRLRAALRAIATMDVYARDGEETASEVMRAIAKTALVLEKE